MNAYKKAQLLGGVCGCMFILLNSTTANANTVTYSNTFSGATDVTSQPINVAQFDSTLGTLTSAAFTLNANMTTQFSAGSQSNTTSFSDFYVGWDKTTYNLSLDGSTGYSGLSISKSLPSTRILGTGTPGTAFSPLTNMDHVTLSTPTTQWIYGGPSLSASNTFTESTSLSPFIGTGNLGFLLTTKNVDTVASSNLNGIPVGLSTNVVGTVNVTYTYSPSAVPIPPASWLFGSGLLGLVGMARRKKAA